MGYNIGTTFGGILDYVSILEIKYSKGIKLSEDSLKWIEDVKDEMYLHKNSFKLEKLYFHLMHINELIWWCMDKQRIYEPDTRDDRREIGMIVAELNDVRDRIKKEINKVCSITSRQEEKSYR